MIKDLFDAEGGSDKQEHRPHPRRQGRKCQNPKISSYYLVGHPKQKKKKKNRQSFGEGHQDIVIDKTGKNKKYEDLGYSGVA